MSKIIQGMKPTKPSFDGLELSIEIWTVMEHCWSPVPEERPRLNRVKDRLRSVNTPELTTQRFRIWKNNFENSNSPQSQRVQSTPDVLRDSRFTMEVVNTFGGLGHKV
jgi:hypothetical protein